MICFNHKHIDLYTATATATATATKDVIEQGTL